MAAPNTLINATKDECGETVTSVSSVLPRESTIAYQLIDFGKPWYCVPGLLKLNIWLAFTTIACVACGYDGSLINGLQALEQWNVYFGYPTGIRLGLLASGFSFGTIIVSFRIADLLSDKFGRKVAICVGQFCSILGAIIQGSSKNYTSFFIARIISGLSYIAPIAAPMLISELAYHPHRGPATGAHNVSWYLGAMIASCITYGTWKNMSNTDDNAWRIPSYLQGMFALINMMFLYWLPESPRYLVSKGKYDKAREFFVKFHADGNEEKGKELVDFEMNEIQTALEYEKISKKTSFMTFFKTKNNFHRVFIAVSLGFMMNFSGNGLLSYYLPKVLTSIGITETQRQLELNIYLTFYNYTTSLIVAFLSSKLKRRFMFLASTISMLTCFIIWTTLSAVNERTEFQHKSLGTGVLAMIFLFNASYNFAVLVMPPVYISELMPFNLRTKGYAIMSLVSNLGNVYNGLVNPIAMDALGWTYYIIFCFLLALMVGIVYFAFVETYGYSLEEISQLVFKEKVLGTFADNKGEGKKAAV